MQNSVSPTPNLNGVNLLIIDRDIANLRVLKQHLSRLGAQVHLASDLESVGQVLFLQQVQAILADDDFIKAAGSQFVFRFKQNVQGGLFFVMSKKDLPLFSLHPDLPVDGILSKPVQVPEFAAQLWQFFRSQDHTPSKLDPLVEILRPYLVFRAPVMRQCLSILPKVAATTHSVLITGETGTGKEMVARAIHGLSPYRNGPFIAVNCGAIPETLIEGELFGHEKGAFTGAQALHHGKFELAQKGTLFLDELGEMPLALQARLLRVLEERQFYRVGGEKPVPVDLRIVAATQVNLERAVENQLFREDLYYRLNIFRIQLPALRQRLEDIPLLAWHFLERAFAEINRPAPLPTLSNGTISLLQNQIWRGNVRELRNLMTRLAVLLPRNVPVIEPEVLETYFPENFYSPQGFKKPSYQAAEPELGASGPLNSPEEGISYPPPREEAFSKVIPAFPGRPRNQDPHVIEVTSLPTEEGIFIPLGAKLEEAEEKIIQATLRHTRGNRTRAAKLLGIGLRTLRRKLNEKLDEAPEKEEEES